MIVIVAHKFTTQPDDELVRFLNQKNYQNIVHIKHSFADMGDRRSTMSWYKNGILYKEVIGYDFLGYPEPLIYLKELFFTFL
jgi:hypothetical protein